MYFSEEVVNAVKRNLGLDNHRNVIEGRPHLVSQQVENCGGG